MGSNLMLGAAVLVAAVAASPVPPTTPDKASPHLKPTIPATPEEMSVTPEKEEMELSESKKDLPKPKPRSRRHEAQTASKRRVKRQIILKRARKRKKAMEAH